jgi:hypothetical protein
MTRKDYEAVARSIRDYLSLPDLAPATQENRIRKNTIDDVIDILSEVFEADNRAFDASRFRSACIPN